jgi:hypothetical protein
MLEADCLDQVSSRFKFSKKVLTILNPERSSKMYELKVNSYMHSKTKHVKHIGKLKYSLSL